MAAASAVAIGMGAVALPAAAHDRGGAAERGAVVDRAAKAERGHTARAARRAGRGMRRCVIAEDRLLTAEDNRHLARLTERLAERVDDGRISQERMDRILARKAKRITIRTTVRTARWAPVFELYGVTGDTFRARRVAPRDAGREAGGVRALLDSRGKTVADLRAARREGRKAGRIARIELCSSGRDEPGVNPGSTEDPAAA